jgi:hypothetical protein
VDKILIRQLHTNKKAATKVAAFLLALMHQAIIFWPSTVFPAHCLYD